MLDRVEATITLSFDVFSFELMFMLENLKKYKIYKLTFPLLQWIKTGWFLTSALCAIQAKGNTALINYSRSQNKQWCLKIITVPRTTFKASRILSSGMFTKGSWINEEFQHQFIFTETTLYFRQKMLYAHIIGCSIRKLGLEFSQVHLWMNTLMRCMHNICEMCSCGT